MSEEELYEKIDFLRKEESEKILKFLLAILLLTFFLLVLFIGFFRSTLAWQLYFFSIFMLVLWLAFRLIELETEIEELNDLLKNAL